MIVNKLDLGDLGVAEVEAGVYLDKLYENEEGIHVRASCVEEFPNVLGITVRHKDGSSKFIPWPDPDSDPNDDYYEVFIPKG